MKKLDRYRLLYRSHELSSQRYEITIVNFRNPLAYIEFGKGVFLNLPQQTILAFIEYFAQTLNQTRVTSAQSVRRSPRTYRTRRDSRTAARLLCSKKYTLLLMPNVQHSTGGSSWSSPSTGLPPLNYSHSFQLLTGSLSTSVALSFQVFHMFTRVS